MIKVNKSSSIFQIINFIIMALIIFITLYPFLYMFAISFSSSIAVTNGLVTILPVDFTTKAYKDILSQNAFWNGYMYTLIYTIGGTLVGLFMSIICAYPLSKKGLKGKSVILVLMVFTMYFSGGLIPTYLLITRIGLNNSIWAIIIPGSINTYNMIIMRTFFGGIPTSLQEAAQIDGMGHIGILMRIILPLSKPIIATMSLFIAVAFWNEWFSALLYVNMDKYPVTLFLRNIIMGSQMAIKGGQAITKDTSATMPETLQAATVMLVTIPILCIYPFIQKYFVHGVMVGSIKG